MEWQIGVIFVTLTVFLVQYDFLPLIAVPVPVHTVNFSFVFFSYIFVRFCFFNGTNRTTIEIEAREINSKFTGPKIQSYLISSLFDNFSSNVITNQINKNS